ncbi:hypothetical protein GXW82_04535 [Streptacidiphilus sp. 4-A2]|nr:hypothetical protein [Streptacidiphilus sp. 4-A2]
MAVRAAHVLAGEFPDGRLFIDLHGYSPGESAVSAFVALGVLLRAVGVVGDRVPEDLGGRVALWRAVLVGRRVLLLVDNVVDAGVVVSLLPSGSGCVVLVTSRARLVDLDGARWVSLGVMDVVESGALVAGVLGAGRVEAEQEAVLEVAALCGYLPLALRIAAARLRNRPRWTVRYLADRLRDEAHRLDELSSGCAVWGRRCGCRTRRWTRGAVRRSGCWDCIRGAGSMCMRRGLCWGCRPGRRRLSWSCCWMCIWCSSWRSGCTRFMIWCGVSRGDWWGVRERGRWRWSGCWVIT